MRKRSFHGTETHGYLDSLTPPIAVQPGDANRLVKTQARTGAAAAGLGITDEQRGALDEADEIHVQRKSIEVAREKMRQQMLDLLPTLPTVDLRKMVDINPRSCMRGLFEADGAGRR